MEYASGGELKSYL
jgi:serine/threonine protein kinase